MARLMTKIALVSAIMLTAACAPKKKVEDLPPPPPAAPTSAEVPPPSPSGPYNTTIPGSRADFVAQAGSDTIHFATDASDVDSESQSILSRQAAWLTKYPNVKVTIEGHCDERGTREYNLALGDRRANAAKNFLVNAGISESRLAVISYGKEKPVATGSDEDSWAQNRRAVTVVPQ